MFDVLKYIHENIKSRIELEDISGLFGYSKWHFCSKFHKYTGKSFVKYIRHYRMQLCALDILSGAKITDVALDYGYDTLGGFNKAFLAEFGCLPREYRKCAKEAELYYERKKICMFPISDRCEHLRRLVTGCNDYEDYYCMQHRVYSVLGMYRASGKELSNTEVLTAGMVNVLNNFSPVIILGELIVGFNFADSKYSEGYAPEDTAEGCEIARLNGINESDIEEYFECIKKNTAFFSINKSILSKEEKELSAERAGTGRCIASNHSVINYEKVIRLGFRGILDEVIKYEEINGTNELYASMKKLCVAACSMGKKYAREARRLKEKTDDTYLIKDLEYIEEVCERVPEKSARTFREAIQALWFAHIINTWEDGINANSLGRLDQILYPYYKADIEKGILTKEEAFELICCLWIKLYLNYDVQQSCVGGTSLDGKSMVNELSYMMLDATEQLDFIRCLSVRFSQNTEKDFLKRALEVVGHV